MSLPDQVWLQIDPRAARVPVRQRLVFAALAAVGATVLAAVLWVTASGTFIHRLDVTSESADGGSSACRQTFTITNHGWLSEQVEGQRLDSDVPGARIIRPLPRIIPSGGHRSLSIALGARWCRAFDRVETPEAQARLDEPTLMLTLHRPWGTSSDAVELREPITHDGFSINW